MKYEYFIVYSIGRGSSINIGNTVFVLDRQIETLEDIRKIEKAIADSLNAQDAAITNFRLLREIKEL